MTTPPAAMETNDLLTARNRILFTSLNPPHLHPFKPDFSQVSFIFTAVILSTSENQALVVIYSNLQFYQVLWVLLTPPDVPDVPDVPDGETREQRGRRAGFCYGAGTPGSDSSWKPLINQQCQSKRQEKDVQELQGCFSTTWQFTEPLKGLPTQT